MLKTLYDTDCTTWSPQGKLFQVEYAQEAVKLGSICIGLRSNKFAVLCSLKRSQSELSGYLEKIFKVDDKIGMAMSGLTADSRVICKYMRNECLNYKYVYESNHPLNRLISKVSDKSQHKTHQSSKRPYGVGLLIVGVDQQGPHLFETSPSGDFYEYIAYAIGSRSQSARTYFETHSEKFQNCDLDQLIYHGLKALKQSSQDESDFSAKSVEIAFVSQDKNFQLVNDEKLSHYLSQLDNFKPDDQMIIE